MTDDKIRVDDAHGQDALEKTAYDVGKLVRDTVIKAVGTHPEDMPLAEHIDKVKKTLKPAGKRLKEIGPEEAESEVLFLTTTRSSPPDSGYTKDPEEDEPLVDSEPQPGPGQEPTT